MKRSEAERPDHDRGVSISEAAKRLGLSQKKVWRMVKRGELMATKIGRVWRIRESEIERLLGPTRSAIE